MPTSHILPLWLRRMPGGWRFHLLMLLPPALAITLALTLRDIFTSLDLAAHYIFWCVTPVTMCMFLIWGQRVFWSVLIGSFIAFLPWFPLHMSLVAALDGALQVSLGIWLVRRFWPAYLPVRPSVRFFALIIGLGVILPVSLISLPVVWVFSSELTYTASFWDSYFAWCISEVSAVLILMPPILMAIYPSFRQTLERPVELVAYILLGIALMVFSVLQSLNVNAPQVVTIESWMLVGTAGFLMIIRNGVGGIIIANLAMAAATITVQIILANNSIHWITPRMLIEFNIYTCHLTGLTLIIAAGFYDYKVLNDTSRSITAKMLRIQISEQRRIAADLHDSVSQEFAAALMHLRTGMMQIPDAKTNSSVQLAEGCLNKGLKDLRQIAVGLRPELLEHGAFADVIESYCATIEKRHGVDILFENELPEDIQKLPLDRREHLFRILQESLHNAIHHGKAKTITVRLLTNPRHTKIIGIVEDDGIGFAPTKSIDTADRAHLGLRLMEERSLMVGGTFSINSSHGKGTTVEVTVPLKKVPKNR